MYVSRAMLVLVLREYVWHKLGKMSSSCKKLMELSWGSVMGMEALTPCTDL